MVFATCSGQHSQIAEVGFCSLLRTHLLFLTQLGMLLWPKFVMCQFSMAVPCLVAVEHHQNLCTKIQTLTLWSQE